MPIDTQTGEWVSPRTGKRHGFLPEEPPESPPATFCDPDEHPEPDAVSAAEVEAYYKAAGKSVPWASTSKSKSVPPPEA